jgi:hypothetical protein
LPNLDERANRISAALDEADTAVDALTSEFRHEHGNEIQRLDDTLYFARICLDATEVESITAEAENAILEAANRIASDAEAAAQTPECADVLLEAVRLLPAARGRDVEQTVFEAMREGSRRWGIEHHERWSHLRGAAWRWTVFQEAVWGWHIHCDLCHYMSFSENPEYGFIRAGWTRIGAPGDPESKYGYWLCPECFDLYRAKFAWTVEEQA